MIRIAALLALMLSAAACSEEPTPAQAEKVLKKVVGSDAENEAKAEAKSIEEAADAAAKLVEEEANEEIEAIRGAETGK